MPSAQSTIGVVEQCALGQQQKQWQQQQQRKPEKK